MVHFVLVAEATCEGDRLPAGALFGLDFLDGASPGLLQQLAVIQQEPLRFQALSGVASRHLASPPLDLSRWQPDTIFRIDVEESAVAHAAACIFDSVNRALAGRLPGHPSAPARAARDLSMEAVGSIGQAALPQVQPSAALWTGEGADAGLCPQVAQPLSGLSDLLALAQSLCRLKGAALKERFEPLRDACVLLQGVQDFQDTNEEEELEARLPGAEEELRELAALLAGREEEHRAHSAVLAEVLRTVVQRAAVAKTALQEARALSEGASQELDSSRIALVSNFLEKDHKEIKSLVDAHCPAGGEACEELPPSALAGLFELITLALKVSARPTRDEVRLTIRSADRLRSLAAADAGSLGADHVKRMVEVMNTIVRAELDEPRSVALLASVVLPIFDAAKTALWMPGLEVDAAESERVRKERSQEIADLQAKDRSLQAELKELRRRLQVIEKEVNAIKERLHSAGERKLRASRLLTVAADHRARWEREVEDLETKLRCLVGDCLLSAAAASYLGPLSQDHRRQLRAHWHEALEECGVAHSYLDDLCHYWMPVTERHRWHAEHGLLQDPHLVEGVVLAMLQSSTWPLVYVLYVYMNMNMYMYVYMFMYTV